MAARAIERATVTFRRRREGGTPVLPLFRDLQVHSGTGTLTIKEWPCHERPRERLRNLGSSALSPRELLAVLIETGIPAADGRPGRSALDVAADLLRAFSPGAGVESLRRISAAPAAALCVVPGIGPAKAAKIKAALELGRRAVHEARPERDRLETARDVFERMQLSMRDLPQEEFHVLLLSVQSELMADVVIARGTLDTTLLHPREVFRPALAESAHAIVLVHNHPSGEPSPSAEDRAVTRRVIDAGALLGIAVFDHIIIGEGRYCSFVEAGIMTEPSEQWTGGGTKRRRR